MSREVRKVPPNWEHPKTVAGRWIPLFDGQDFLSAVAEWDIEASKWAAGEFPDYADEDDRRMSYEDWNGPRPQAEDYMPVWAPEEATHLMMYETTSEGTPKSPAFATPEELAAWLVATGASAWAGQTASYEAWLRVARGASTVGAVSANGGPLVNGVEAGYQQSKEQ